MKLFKDSETKLCDELTAALAKNDADLKWHAMPGDLARERTAALVSARTALAGDPTTERRNAVLQCWRELQEIEGLTICEQTTADAIQQRCVSRTAPVLERILKKIVERSTEEKLRLIRAIEDEGRALGEIIDGTQSPLIRLLEKVESRAKEILLTLSQKSWSQLQPAIQFCRDNLQ